MSSFNYRLYSEILRREMIHFDFVQNYPGKPVPEETFTLLTPIRRIRTDNKVHCMAAHSLYSALSQRGC